MSRWACSRCGLCCKNVTSRLGQHEFGIYLDPSEIDRFPKGSVFPLFGRGQPIEVTAYQLGVKRCPNYVEENGLGRCGIHERRPLVCQSYPVRSRISVDLACPEAARMTDGIEPDSIAAEIKAHDEKILKAIDQPKNEYMWPLDERRWIPLPQEAM